MLDAASKAGLPGIDIVKEERLQEAEMISKEVANGLAKERFEEIAALGHEMFELVGAMPDPETILANLGNLIIPPVVCNDAEVHLLLKANELWTSEMIENWCGNCSSWSRTFSDFLNACQR